MDFVVIVVKVVALYLVISGLFLILRGKTLPTILRDLFNHPAIVYIAGVFLVFLGLALIIKDDALSGTERTVAAIFGWLTFLKGVIYISFPNALSEINIIGLTRLTNYGYAPCSVIPAFAGMTDRLDFWEFRNSQYYIMPKDLLYNVRDFA